MNKENIIKVADFIEDLPFIEVAVHNPNDPPSFTMQSIEYKYCNSPACICGWTIYLLGDQNDDEIEEIGSFNYAGNLLGIPPGLSEYLFEPDTNDACISASNPKMKGFISPKRAAKVMRNLAETGEVDWSIR